MYIPDHPHSLQTVQWNKLPHCLGREYQRHEDDERRTHSPEHTHIYTSIVVHEKGTQYGTHAYTEGWGQRETEKREIPDHPHTLQTVQWNKLPHCLGREYQRHEDDERRTHSPEHTYTLCRHCIVGLVWYSRV